jgi:hypothetical protein
MRLNRFIISGTLTGVNPNIVVTNISNWNIYLITDTEYDFDIITTRKTSHLTIC